MSCTGHYKETDMEEIKEVSLLPSAEKFMFNKGIIVSHLILAPMKEYGELVSENTKRSCDEYYLQEIAKKDKEIEELNKIIETYISLVDDAAKQLAIFQL